ncbi:MAG TPA: hypothetical protein PLH93_01470 [Flavobacteriales bacterium]|nr:hypothetical protein [Flavobacteriales bacterium]
MLTKPTFRARWWPAVAVLVVFVLLCAAYEYGRVLHLPPQPHHLWRQTNCLAIAYTYYAWEWNLFRPAVMSMISDHGMSGRSAGEFPILYYLVGLLWKVTGPQEIVFRILMLLLHATGTLALFRSSALVIGDRFWAAFIGLLFFTSPAVVYFTLAFLPDVPALDLSFIAWALLIDGVRCGRERAILGSAALFALAGAIKLTALMSPLAICAYLVLSRLVDLPGFTSTIPVGARRAILRSSIVAILAVALWVGYSYWYNHVHGGEYSHQGTWAYWDLHPDERSKAARFGTTVMPGMLFHWSAWALFLLCVPLLLLFQRDRGILVLNGIFLLGTIVFVLLWFVALDNHDYYFIVPMITLVVLLVSTIHGLRARMPRPMSALPVRITLVLFFAVNALYAREDHVMRTRGPMSVDALHLLLPHGQALEQHYSYMGYWQYEPLLDIRPLMRAHGIRKDDKVIVLPDESIGVGPYLVGQRGENSVSLYIIDAPAIQRAIARGAGYLVLLDVREDWRPWIGPFLEHPLFEHRGVRVYDLRPLAG